MFSLSLIASIVLVPFVAAQGTTDNSVAVKAIEAHFEGAKIVPDYFKEFEPTALLSMNFPGAGTLTPGQKVTKEQVNPTPVVTVTPAEDGSTLEGLYTIAMIDVDYVGADVSGGVTRHWLANGITIGTDNTVSNATATVITPYGGPWPAAGSGSHRYIVALYQQPSTFAAPDGFTGPLEIAKMDWLKYVEDSNLGPLVAANYINVEEGTSTVSAIATSAVVSSTLAPASSGTSTGTGTTTRATGTSTSAGASPSNGALKLALSPVAALAVAGLTFVAL